eukprot:scaffold10110_cov69-Phaeocystis_antarctica.AAC.6
MLRIYVTLKTNHNKSITRYVRASPSAHVCTKNSSHESQLIAMTCARWASHQRAATPENSRRTRRRLLSEVRGVAAAPADSAPAPIVRLPPWIEDAFALGSNARVYGVASARASVW